MIADVTAGMADHEREGHVDQRDPRLLGQPRERVGGVELALVLRAATGRSAPGAARRASTVGASWPLRYRRVSQPPASGLQGITPMP